MTDFTQQVCIKSIWWTQVNRSEVTEDSLEVSGGLNMQYLAKGGRMNVTITAAVPIEMAQTVDGYAKQSGTTRSRVVRDALEQYLLENGGEGEQRASECEETDQVAA